MYFFQLKSDPLSFHVSEDKPTTGIIELYEGDFSKFYNSDGFDADNFDTCREILEYYKVQATDLSPGEFLYRKKDSPYFIVSDEPPTEYIELYKTHELMGALSFVRKEIISKEPYTFKVLGEQGITFDKCHPFNTCDDLVWYLDFQCRESIGYYTYLPDGLKNMGHHAYMRDFWFYEIP
jgi:hypothetical protein